MDLENRLVPGDIVRRSGEEPYHYLGSVWDGESEICIFWVWNKRGKYRSYKAVEKQFV